METDALIHSNITAEHDSISQQMAGASTAFNWEVSDTALLLPNHLGISKVQRAWDRKPKVAFSRPGSRVGKVWKRGQNVSAQHAMADLTNGADPQVTKRRKARRTSPGGERKPLKKMCLDSGFGLAPRVLAWDGAESPTRKIVTRTSAANTELIALSEEDEIEVEIEEQANVTIEVLDEDGTVLDVNPEGGVDQDGWEDEIQDTPPEEDEFNDTMMHLADIIAVAEQQNLAQASPVLAEDLPTMEEGDDLPEIEQENQDPIFMPPPQAQQPQQEVASMLPEGFVSPMKPAVPVVKARRRSLGPSRRRTLPRMFAPSPLSQVMNMEESFHELAQEHELSSPMAKLGSTPNHENALGPIDGSPGAEGQWEDVEDVSPPRSIALNSETPPIFQAESTENNPKPADSPLPAANIRPSEQLLSSPIPTIEGQHPRLPLRRSPRRKSSSPRKMRTILPATDKPHLIAFTPIKGFAHPVLQSTEPVHATEEELADADDEEDLPSSPLERSVSAPPEEPQMSPRKPLRPRISDDTALLQAFLNRAAENKGNKRMSASKRESITNRRDSDAVRSALGQAIMSPAKADVLGELDVNSPSPRKPSSSAMDTSSAFDEVINEAAKAAQDEAADESSIGLRTRRGGRGGRKAQPSQQAAAPNKISIRGNSDGVVLKRTEAQEMAQLTRNNTKKNKGGAVLPPLRLTKLASLLNPDVDVGTDSQAEATQLTTNGRRNIRWAETLAEYYQGGEPSETSVLSDELNAPSMQREETADKMELESMANTEEVGMAPPPSGTPSKPKIRRLKAPRTAAAPGHPPAIEAAIEPERPAVSEAKPPAPIKRRSRIATPAKGLTSASLLPPDLDPQPIVPTAPTELKKTAPAKKKAAPISKLPAPSSTSLLGQGKENLISSPAKKKPAASSTTMTKNALPTAKTFAPKLDCSKAAALAPTFASGGEAEAVPGLMSPAKKGGRSRNVLAKAKEVESDTGVLPRPLELPGLSSPAKKRTRRAGL